MPNDIGIKRLSPYLIILLFFLYKLTHLNVSFFWDESWVYAPALRTLADIGPSLLPDAMPLDYSRGHPLLFHFLGSLWIRIFGEHYFSMHFFALTVSVGYLMVVVSLLKYIVESKVVFWTLLLLCIQPLFVAQSSMVLPEMMLATWTLMAILFYIKGKYFFYFISACLVILTKETGIIIVASIVLFDFMLNLKDRSSLKKILSSGIVYSLPLLTLVLHMLYLKWAYGWYLYPEHTEMIKSDFKAISDSFFHLINHQVFAQKRFLISAPFIVAYLLKLFWTKKLGQIVFALLTIGFSALLGFIRNPEFAFAMAYISLAAHYSFSKLMSDETKTRSFALFFLFIIAYGVFSAFNFYTVRYLLSTFILSLIIPIYFLMTEVKYKKMVPYYFIAITPIFIFELLNPRSINDVNLTYLNYSPVLMEVIKYCEEEELYDEQINTLFLSSVALSDFKAGYRNTKTEFKYINKEDGSGEDYFIFDNIEPNGQREGFQGEILKRVEKGNIWIEIWRGK